MTLRARIAIASAIALAAATTSLAAPAFASDASADARMITVKDVPASFGKAKTRDFDAKLVGKVIGICDNASGTTLVSVPAPAKQYFVDIETATKNYTDVMERVYAFPTPQAATDAFNTLFKDLSTCDGTSTLQQGGPDLTQTVTTGSYPGGEYADFWVNVKGTWTGGQECKKPCRTVVQAVYVQAGDAIVETVAYINGKGQLTGKQTNDLADLAEELGARWAS